MRESNGPNPNLLPINPNLLFLKPRAVSLSKMDAHRSKVMPILLDSIANFFHINGFSRTLNKFRSEAHLQEDSGKCPAVDLEEMCLKFMASVNGSVTSDAVKKDAENKSKHKKKKASHSTEIQREDESNADTGEYALDECGSLAKEDNAGKKSKDKKKRDKGATDVKVVECKDESVKRVDNGKSSLDDSGGLVKNVGTNSDGRVVSNESKAMKKRKRHVSVVDETKSMNGVAVNESIPKCVDASEDFQSEKKKLKASTNSESTGSVDTVMKNGHDNQFQEPSLVHCNSADKKNSVKEEEKSANQNSMKKQRNGSAEPASVKAFQRIKVEEVTFADERLKDNSYWAKHGAETGYGAKAQEVLGQVKGRDFRHEKTKKKRGSYRGGQIDLQSHSIKFNYSDGE